MGKFLLRQIAMRFFILALCLLAARFSLAGVSGYAGTLGGVATLSADAGSQSATPGLALSAYTPANGGTLDIFAGADLHDYFSVQGDFIWNSNDLRLSSTSSNGSFYQETRSSSQEAAIVSLLVYFRSRKSRIRPYLAVGTGLAHLTSASEGLIASGGTPSLPPSTFSSIGASLRTHVGIDIRLIRRLAFRYSFSETLSNNEISKQLSPPGPAGSPIFKICSDL